MAQTAQPSTMKLKDMDFEQLKFTEKRESKNTKGTDNVFIAYGENKEWPRIQFPLLRHPFDPTVNDDGSMTLTLSFTKENVKHQRSIDKLREFDRIILDKIRENSKAWIKKDTLDDNWIQNKYVSFLKIKTAEVDGITEEKYFNIKVKLPVKRDDNAISTEIFDSEMRRVDPSHITPRCQIEPIARPSRIWFQKTGKVGTTWECRFVRVKTNPPATGSEQIFPPSDDEEEPRVPATTEQNVDAASAVAVANDENNHDDSASETNGDGDDDDDDEKDSVPTEPVIAAKPKARRVVGRKAG